MQDLKDFLSPVDIQSICNDEVFTEGQFAKHIAVFEKEIPNIEDIDIVILGMGESRGSGIENTYNNAPDKIRKQFYSLFCWHSDIKIADLGNIKNGADIKDSYAALKTVLVELFEKNKIDLIFEKINNTL